MILARKQTESGVTFVGIPLALFGWMVAALLLLTTCDIFGPPFNFNNPYDPKQEISALDPLGHPLFESGGGLVRSGPMAVWSDGFQHIIATPGHPGTIALYRAGDATYETLYTGDEHNQFLRDLCFNDEGGSYLYAAVHGGVHRTAPSSESSEPYWLAMDDYEFYRLAPDPSGGLWAIAVERHHNANGYYVATNTHLLHIGSQGDVNHLNWLGGWHLDYHRMDIAVSGNLLAVSREEDILFFSLGRDGFSSYGEFRGRLVYNDGLGDFELVTSSDDVLYGWLGVRSIAYDPVADRFVTAGEWNPTGDVVAFLNGTDGSFVSSTGGVELPDYDWHSVATTGGDVYVSNHFTREVRRVGDWSTVHENVVEDELGFLEVSNLTVDRHANPPMLYALDREYGAVHVINAQTLEFERFFGTRGFSESEIRNPRALVATADALLLAKFDRIFVYSRDGSYSGTLGEHIGQDIRDFVVLGDEIVSLFDSGGSVGLHSYTLGTGENGRRYDVFSGGAGIALMPGSGDAPAWIVGVRHDASMNEVSIVDLDPVSLNLEPTGSFTTEIFRRGSDDHLEVRIEDIAATPQGFIWILNGPGVVVKTDRTGEIHKTIQLPDGQSYRSIAAGDDGQVHVGGERTILVYGPDQE